MSAMASPGFVSYVEVFRFGYCSSMRVISKAVPVFLVLNLSLALCTKALQVQAVAVDHRLQAEGHANLNPAAVFDEPHPCVVGGNERFSVSCLPRKAEQDASHLAIARPREFDRHGAILRLELTHR